MIQMFGNRRLARFALAVALAGTSSAAIADVLVLRSNGPTAGRYSPGQRLPDNASFALRPGDSVTILTRGGTRTFRGPGTFSATGAATGQGLTFSGPRRATGAVRGNPAAASSPLPQPSDVWHLDVSRSGRACLAPGSRPTLWRPDAGAAVQLTITPPTGAPQTLNWPAGQPTLPWPAAVRIADGASYQLSWTGAPTPRRLTLRTLSASPAGDEALASALIANDCSNQLSVFIADRAIQAGSPTPNGGAAQ
jgi:hypothetical protein